MPIGTLPFTLLSASVRQWHKCGAPARPAGVKRAPEKPFCSQKARHCLFSIETSVAPITSATSAMGITTRQRIPIRRLSGSLCIRTSHCSAGFFGSSAQREMRPYRRFRGCVLARRSLPCHARHELLSARRVRRLGLGNEVKCIRATQSGGHATTVHDLYDAAFALAVGEAKVLGTEIAQL